MHDRHDRRRCRLVVLLPPLGPDLLRRGVPPLFWQRQHHVPPLERIAPPLRPLRRERRSAAAILRLPDAGADRQRAPQHRLRRHRPAYPGGEREVGGGRAYYELRTAVIERPDRVAALLRLEARREASPPLAHRP